jgi:hypothetical protein
MGGSESFVDCAEKPGQQTVPAQRDKRPCCGHNSGVCRREKSEDCGEAQCDFTEAAHKNCSPIGNGSQRMTQRRRLKHTCSHQHHQTVENANYDKRNDHSQRYIARRIPYLLGNAGNFQQTGIGNEHKTGGEKYRGGPVWCERRQILYTNPGQSEYNIKEH